MVQDQTLCRNRFFQANLLYFLVVPLVGKPLSFFHYFGASIACLTPNQTNNKFWSLIQRSSVALGARLPWLIT